MTLMVLVIMVILIVNTLISGDKTTECPLSDYNGDNCDDDNNIIQNLGVTRGQNRQIAYLTLISPLITLQILLEQGEEFNSWTLITI